MNVVMGFPRGCRRGMFPMYVLVFFLSGVMRSTVWLVTLCLVSESLLIWVEKETGAIADVIVKKQKAKCLWSLLLTLEE